MNVLQTIERHQMLLIGAGTLIFTLGVTLGGTPCCPPRHRATLELQLGETHPGMLWESTHRRETVALAPADGSESAARSPLEYDLAALRSPQFRQEVTASLKRGWTRAAYTVRDIDGAGRVEISAYYPLPADAVSVVNAVATKWYETVDSLEGAALAKGREFYRKEAIREASARVRLNCFGLEPTGPKSKGVFADLRQQADQLIASRAAAPARTLPPVRVAQVHHSSAPLLFLLGLFSVWLSCVIVAVVDRKRQRV